MALAQSFGPSMTKPYPKELCYCPNCSTPTVDRKNRCRKCGKAYKDSLIEVKKPKLRLRGLELPLVKEVIPRHISKDLRQPGLNLDVEELLQ